MLSHSNTRGMIQRLAEEKWVPRGRQFFLHNLTCKITVTEKTQRDYTSKQYLSSPKLVACYHLCYNKIKIIT